MAEGLFSYFSIHFSDEIFLWYLGISKFNVEATKVFFRSMATVIGPTPPRTGEIQDARF